MNKQLVNLPTKHWSVHSIGCPFLSSISFRFFAISLTPLRSLEIFYT